MSKDKKLAQVLHFDLQGKRDFKYDFLNENSLASIAWNKLEPKAPNYFLVKKDFDESGVYEKGFKMDELFVLNSVGFVTSKDAFLIDFKSEKLIEKQIDIYNIDLSNQEFNDIYKLESKYFNVIDARKKAILEKSSVIINFFYRPMDVRYILYEKHFLERNRFNVLKH
ncbi:MAG: type ISP restriction/modification enzyme, partial [Ferruginibacter sp.]